MSITFDTTTNELKADYDNALTDWNSVKVKVDNATDVFNRAIVKCEAANISTEQIADAVNLIYPDANDKGTDSTVAPPYVSAVAIGYVRAKKAHDKAHDNLCMAIERLESAIDAYNTHVSRKYDEKALTVPWPGTIFKGEPYLVFHGSVDDRLIGIPAGDSQIHNLYDSDDVCILTSNKSEEGMMPSYTYVTFVDENGVVGPV